ncbi:MAG TPA: protein kinase G-activating protein GlnX [Mycobacterium sp.]|nr:protein kinase G-activating protein GlnX [Mycobacterium sp.]
MTVELAHPSTEPAASQAAVDPAHPRWWFWTTTPGRILVSGVVLIALVALSAFATASTINNRQRALTTVLNHTEPLAFAAGQLYTTLSVADAAASTAFISAGAEPREVRQRYEQAITNAAVALTRASGGLTDPSMQNLLGRINARLAVYTGLVETARTNNRAGDPIGSSYLSEASSMMQDQILPDAKQLYDETSAKVDSETTASTDIPTLGILVVTATLLFGAYANRWLARKTQRRLNFGFVAGGVAVLIMVMWVGTVLTISTTDSRSAKGTAAESLKTVTNLAILAQQARADETLALIRRGDEDVRKQSFYQRIDTMHQQLDGYLKRDDAIDKSDLQNADELLVKWRHADERINSYIAVGNYQAATQVALGTSEEDSTPAFDRLEQSLTNGIEDSRRELRNDIVNARAVLSGSTVGAVLLSVVAALAVTVGLWPRMSEYR